MTTIDDPRGQVLRIRQTAIACPHVLGAREADAMVDHILYYAIATLRRDQRITQLPLIACELLFVETRNRATEELVRQIAGKAVLRVAVDCIADAILVCSDHDRLRSLPDGCTPLVFFDPQYRERARQAAIRQRRRAPEGSVARCRR